MEYAKSELGSAKPPRATRHAVLPARRWWVPVLLLLLWQAVTMLGIFTSSQLPGPLEVLTTGWQMAITGRLLPHVLTSLGRVALGFAIGAILGVLLGSAVGLSRPVEEAVDPTLQALRSIPSLAWVPLLLLWMGIDEPPKITLIAIGAFFPVYLNTVGGMRSVDRKLVEVGEVYGLSGGELVRRIILPAALPSLLTGLRIGLGQAWLFLVAAELIAASRGLGFLLIDAQNSARADIVLMSIVILALLGQLSDALLRLGTQPLLRWQDTFKGRG